MCGYLKMDLTPTNSELFIGIVARIGVDTKVLVETLSRELKYYNYESYEIHTTLFLKAFKDKFKVQESPVEDRYNSYISACNSFRSDFSYDVMSKLAIMQIVKERKSQDGSDIDIQKRRVFIINQIKRPEESELLRNVYGEHYIQISCHADENIRIQKLHDKISQSHFENPKSSEWDIKARELVHSDESQEDVPNGQRVRQVFPLSDVIINSNNEDDMREGFERFLRLFFGDKSVTPTEEEYGMELASTASQRSSDLSRQVGAAILNGHMEIQALGCNEVPKSGGGTYWAGSSHDGRDFALGVDSNEQRRRAVLLDLIDRLKQTGALSEKLEQSSKEELISFVFERDDKIISDAQIMDSLEYGRSVHAEMNAITDAARGGHSIRNCKLFTNTFPCHNCAKHIVASGISEVIYIHPYPKSYAKELFQDSIEINPPRNSSTSGGRVGFRQFIGIVGPMYARLFTKARWKKNGGIVPKFDKKTASYIRRTPIPVYIDVEALILSEFEKDLAKKEYINR